MKYIMSIVISFIICFATFAQLKGTTSIGRIVSLKEQAKILDKLPPVITLTQPYLNNGDTLIVNNNFITIFGSVTDKSDNIILFMNSKIEPLTNDNKFSKSYNLVNGAKTFRLTAIDKYKNSSSIQFTIIYSPITLKPVITLLEPQIKNGKELAVNEKMLTIRGNVKTENGIEKIVINNRNASLLNNGEFYINYSLTYGRNSIIVKATDKHGYSTEKNIIISWTPDITGPIIKIIEPPVSRGIKIVSKTDVLLLKGHAIDESGILGVTINNREANVMPNGDFNINLFLEVGDNPVIIKAIDLKYNVTVDTFVVTRKFESLITEGRYIALVIGINSYKGYWPPLANAANDAKGLAKVLKNKYKFDSVITILNKEATRGNIIHALEKLTINIKRDDNLLIYYSGHGQFKKGLNKGYWVPADAKSNSIADFISNNEIKTFLGGIPAKHTLLISDACFAGDIFRGRPTVSASLDPKNMERYYREVYSKISRIAITSGGLEEVQDAGKDGHSIFTYYLLKSLRENKNKYLDVLQLFSDFRIAVTNNSEQTPLLQVVRDTGDEGGQFIFVNK